LALIALLAAVGILNAAPTALDISWWTVDGGGGTLSDGTFSLSGTVGQSEAGAALENDGYSLVGGYWYGAGEEEQWYTLFLPAVIRNH
jgi:hypothetical protein